MNKVISTLLLTAGLLLVDVPEASAHPEVRNPHLAPAHYRVDHRRAHPMPRWLKRDKSFRHWYAQTRFKWDRRVGWRQLFDIYRWERSYQQRYRVRHYDRGRHGHRIVRETGRLQAHRHRH